MLRQSESEMNYSFCGLRLFKNAKTLLFIVKHPACISIPYHTHWQRLSLASTQRLRRSFWSHYRCHSLVWSSWQKQMRQWCYWEFVPLSFNHVWSINVDAFWCIVRFQSVECVLYVPLLAMWHQHSKLKDGRILPLADCGLSPSQRFTRSSQLEGLTVELRSHLKSPSQVRGHIPCQAEVLWSCSHNWARRSASSIC